MDKETSRQVFHIIVGLCALAVLFYLGRGMAIGATFFTILIGTVLINLRLLGGKMPLVQWFEERFERETAPLPGWGSACYAAGVLMLLTFLHDINTIAACIFMLAVGDGLSTIVGRMGRIKIPYNGDKTLEGAIAFFLSSLPAYFFIGPIAIPLAFAIMIVETLPVLEDNLAIPAACVIFFMVV